MAHNLFGHVPGVEEGEFFVSRRQLFDRHVHRALQAGIAGTAPEGAQSIVLSGGYEDDQDMGKVIVYTGQGGRDPKTGKQVADQTLTRGNLALAFSHSQGIPVRVIRGATLGSKFAPQSGYRYDGLFKVEDRWSEIGQSGFLVWRYRLIRIEEVQMIVAAEEQGGPSSRREITIQRIVRDTRIAKQVKKIHDFVCQVCGVRLETPGGPYAEGAHIRPLGKPHDGPDTTDNILCLCANHHVLFDLGNFAISDNFELMGLEGRLRTHPGHSISKTHLAYRREHYSTNN